MTFGKMDSDLTLMQRCLILAARGLGKVSPNPMVGCVIVAGGIIVGEGWHQTYGMAHAEVNAILQVEEQFGVEAAAIFRSATLYVSLEPCAHYGKTPPCANLIISKGINKVVIGCKDPFVAVNGKGIEKLENAGITVITGILETECRKLNRRFFTSIEKQRPWVILKWATSIDGYLAPVPYENYWLTGSVSKRLVHLWRSQEDAVLVGKRTALQDNPELTVRSVTGRNPVRLVIDWGLELPLDLKIFNSKSKTLVFNGLRAGTEKNIRYIHLEFRDYLVPYLLYQLYMLDIGSVIVEGGRETLDLFIKAGLWDEAKIFTSPHALTKGLVQPSLHRSPDLTEACGNDTLRIYYNTSA